MNAFITLLPILAIRYALLIFLNKEAFVRAAHFAPLQGKERVAFGVYQVTLILFAVALMFHKIKTGSAWFYSGFAVYGLGLILYARSMVDYARPKSTGLNTGGLYRLSRNPMYVAFFLCLLGCVLMSASWLLLVLLGLFQVSSHWIILSEERWCIREFGKEYTAYMDRVRRYL